MRTFVANLVLAVAAAILALTGAASAQQSPRSFDAGKFFEELNNRGVNTKGIDGQKFFDELANRGVNSKTPLDGKKFFEELANRGVNVKGVDGNVVLGELQDSGVILPDMVLINRPQIKQ